MMKFFLLTVLISYLLIPRVVAKPAEEEINDTVIASKNVHPLEVNCECGVFEATEPDENSTPLLVQKPIAVTCGDDGQKTCVEFCTNLGKLSKTNGPAILCAVLQHAHALKPSIFGRSCQTGPWQYTGLTSQELICCHGGNHVPCQIAEPIKP